MKHFLFAVTIILTSFRAQALVDIYGGINFGSAAMQETTGGVSYRHSSMFFVGHWGVSAGARLTLDLGPISLGPVGEFGFIGDTFERKRVDRAGDTQYRVEAMRTLGGASLSFNLPVVSILAEYYPYAQNNISYVNDASNPFVRNDRLNGIGGGLGLMFKMGVFNYSVLYRRFEYAKVQMRGADVTLPNSQYSKLTVDDILTAVGFRF